MVRGKKTHDQIAKEQKITTLLQELQVEGMKDIRNLFKEMIGKFLKNGPGG